MESWIIWIVTFILITVVFIPYFIKFRRLQKQDKVRKAEAECLGADKAIAQHPQIDQLSCIGCGACVAACPEGDVLGVVMGKATVINGLKCVGHGRCAEVCPVEAITVGLGDIKMRDDLPALSEEGETNIAGLYIAGELGGLARQQGNTVTISYRKEKFFRIKSRNAERLKGMTDAGKISTILNSNVKRIDEKSVLLEVNGEEKKLKNDFEFIFAGGEPPFKLLKEIGIAFGQTKSEKR